LMSHPRAPWPHLAMHDLASGRRSAS
jgi:hypothetical protein